MSQIGDVHRLPLEDRPDADVKLERPWLLLHAALARVGALEKAAGAA